MAESELAVVEGYWHYRFLYDEELHIISVDGKREGGRTGWPYAYSVSLPPGKHWLQFAILRNSGAIAMCAFEWDFEPKHHYKLKRLDHDQALLAHPTTPRFAASLSVEVAAPAKPPETIRIPAHCGKHPICRQSSDCPPNRSCQFDAHYDFGTCELIDR